MEPDPKESSHAVTANIGKDEPPGIEPATKGTLRKEKENGISGLGLAWAQNIIEANSDVLCIELDADPRAGIPLIPLYVWKSKE